MTSVNIYSDKRSANKFYKFIGWLMIIFSLFPYVDTLGLKTNTQPNAIVCASIIIFFVKKQEVLFIFKYFIFVSIMATLILLLSDFSFLEVRDWINYLSLILVSLATYSFLNVIKGDFYDIFFWSVLIWTLVGLIQLTFDPTFLTGITSTSNGTLSSGRGVAALSPEPTYYGLVVLCFSVIYIANKWYLTNRLVGILLLAQLFIFSRSTTGFIALFFALLIYVIYSLNFKTLLKAIGVLIAIGICLHKLGDNLVGLRFYDTFSILIENPELLLNDLSILERLNHILFPILGCIENFFVPKGFGVFADYLTFKSSNSIFSMLLEHPAYTLVEGKTRIMSGYGKGIFELGIFGCLIPIVINKSVISRETNVILSLILFHCILTMSFVFMTATAPFMIGNLIYITTRTSDVEPNILSK